MSEAALQENLDLSRFDLTAEEKVEIENAIEEFHQAASEPVALEASFNLENAEAFLRGDATLAELLGVNSEEAYGIAQLAYDLSKNGNSEDATSLGEGLITLNPYEGYFHSLLASIYIADDRLDDALEQLDLAIELTPDDIEALVNRGEIHLGHGNFQAAAGDFEAAIKLDPEGETQTSNRARMLATVAAVIIKQSLERHEQAAN